MFCTGNTLLLLKVSSFSNRSLIMLRAGSMGTESGQCSNIVGTETFSWKESNLPNLTYKVTGTLYVVWQFPYKGLTYLSNDLCHPTSDRASARYYWPWGVPVLWLLGSPQNSGAVQPVGYIVLYILSSMLVSLFILHSFCINCAC